jgi:uncharacterized membrane protein
MVGRDTGTKTKAAVVEAAGSAKKAVIDATDVVGGYVDPLAKDEKLRERLAAALIAGLAAQQRVRERRRTPAFALRFAADPVLHAQLIELARQLRKAQKRAQKIRGRRLRNTILFLSGIGLVAAAVPSARTKAISVARSLREDAGHAIGGGKQAVIAEEVDVAVPVTTAYNQWTQFEEFPRFMEGVDEVRQLDDTHLHWAATVAGKHAEWDAKIVEQEPDRRIVWESTDGKQTRGVVSFDQLDAGRTRIRLHMSYTAASVGEQVGSTLGLDRRRVRGDLQRFRELVEERHVETGAWRGEIKDGAETTGGASDS